MRLVDSWIDPEQLAKLASELTGDTPGDAGAGEGEEGGPAPLLEDGFVAEEGAAQVVGEPEVQRLSQQLAEIKERAARSGLLRSVPGAPLPVGVPPTGVPTIRRLPGTGGSLVERLESFVEWAAIQEGLTGLFIADFAGNELVESGADPALVASGVALAEGWERARGELENTAVNGVSTGASVRDAEGSVLTVFSCRSAYGRHVLGALTPEPLGNALSGGLRAGFARVMGVAGNL